MSRKSLAGLAWIAWLLLTFTSWYVNHYDLSGKLAYFFEEDIWITPWVILFFTACSLSIRSNEKVEPTLEEAWHRAICEHLTLKYGREATRAEVLSDAKLRIAKANRSLERAKKLGKRPLQQLKAFNRTLNDQLGSY